jgi:hypothetical protein
MRKKTKQNFNQFSLLLLLLLLFVWLYSKKIFFYTHILRKHHTKLYKDMSERKKKEIEKEIKTHTINDYPLLIFRFFCRILNNTHTQIHMFVTEETKDYLQSSSLCSFYFFFRKKKIKSQRSLR